MKRRMVLLWMVCGMGFAADLGNSGLSQMWDRIHPVLGPPVGNCEREGLGRLIKLRDVGYNLSSCQVFEGGLQQTAAKLSSQLKLQTIQPQDEHFDMLQKRGKTLAFQGTFNNLRYQFFLLQDQDELKLLIEPAPAGNQQAQPAAGKGFSNHTPYFLFADLQKAFETTTIQAVLKINMPMVSGPNAPMMTLGFELGSDLVSTHLGEKLVQVAYAGMTNCESASRCFVPAEILTTLMVVQRKLYQFKLLPDQYGFEINGKNKKRVTLNLYTWDGQQMVRPSVAGKSKP